MKILVFDTCFNKTYIVLKYDDKIIENRVISSTASNYHSVFLMPEITNILKKNNLFFKDIDVLGVDIGPGSFTGIRTGVTAARVFAQQTGIKPAGICSLQILSKLNTTGKAASVVTDARKNKVYYARYKGDNVITEPVLIEKDLLIDKLPPSDFIISDNSIGNFLKENKIGFLNYEENDENTGIFLADIVSNKIKQNMDDYNWAKVKPLYIQPPSISKPKETKKCIIK